MSLGCYLRPASLSEALTALAASPFDVLAGGTDFYPARAVLAPSTSILDITAITELAGLHQHDEVFRIGAAVTWSDLVRTTLPPQLHGLQAAAREVGGVQVQNSGTLVGNVCNASPAADGIPALMALDAQIELASLAGVRCVPLVEFVLGSRRTLRAPDELVTAILVPLRPRARSQFLKLGHRRYLVISIVMVAVVLEIDNGIVVHAAVAVGACSAVARRLPSLEKKLLAQPAVSGLSAVLDAADLSPLTPLDDVRGSGTFRRDAAQTLIARAIEGALGA